MSLKTLNKMVHEMLKNAGRLPAVYPEMEEVNKVNDISTLDENNVNFNKIRKMAKGMQINTYRMKLPELIHSIQRAENNIQCYGTPRAGVFNEEQCFWRSSCMVTCLIFSGFVIQRENLSPGYVVTN
jgi:hypothetical protein